MARSRVGEADIDPGEANAPPSNETYPLHGAVSFECRVYHDPLRQAFQGAPYAHAPTGNRRKFQYLELAGSIRVEDVVRLLLGSGSLVALFHEGLTRHFALMWGPVILSGAALLNAAYDGCECPVDVGVG